MICQSPHLSISPFVSVGGIFDGHVMDTETLDPFLKNSESPYFWSSEETFENIVVKRE